MPPHSCCHSSRTAHPLVLICLQLHSRPHSPCLKLLVLFRLQSVTCQQDQKMVDRHAAGFCQTSSNCLLWISRTCCGFMLFMSSNHAWLGVVKNAKSLTWWMSKWSNISHLKVSCINSNQLWGGSVAYLQIGSSGIQQSASPQEIVCSMTTCIPESWAWGSHFFKVLPCRWWY